MRFLSLTGTAAALGVKHESNREHKKTIAAREASIKEIE